MVGLGVILFNSEYRIGTFFWLTGGIIIFYLFWKYFEEKN